MDLVFTLADHNLTRGEEQLFEDAVHFQDHETEIAGIETILGYWDLVVAVVGTPANCLVLYLTGKLLRQRSRRAPHRHQSNLWFVCSMTLADLLFTAVHAPMAFAEYTLRVKYDSAACFARYIVTNSCTVSSSISLLWLNVDKFLYLNQPLHYRCLVSSRRALGATLVAWAIGVLWSLFFMLGPFTSYTPPCTFRPSNLYLYIAFALVFFVLPTAVCLAVSAYIACVLVRVSRRHARGTVTARTIAFVFTTTVWTAVTYLPYRIAYLVYISPVFPANRPAWLMRLLYFLAALLATNAVGNPFITVLTQRQYSASVGLRN